MDTAIQCIYRDLEYAKSLIKRKLGKNAEGDRVASGDGADESVDDDEDDEESWTFVGGDEPDPDFVTKKLSESVGGLGPAGLPNRGPVLGSLAIKGGAAGPSVTGM